MLDAIQKFAFVRRCVRMDQVHSQNLFPDPDVLLVLERKYGDALTFEDLNGAKQRKRRRRNININASQDSVLQDNTLTEGQSLLETRTNVTRTDMMSMAETL
jgi:hypothetical protein